MSTNACPQCFLPRDPDAWQCDGCGLAFRRDYEAVRLELRGKLRKTRAALIVLAVVAAAFAAGIVYLAMHGFIYISIPLALGVFGSIVQTVRRRAALREQLHELDRRHVPLPSATITSSR
ncbi:MAG TPA: hypothetical protein VH143_20130 [Kofleriaceae bacterium]|nr:hypothetical protein [Kofleriaceae bacterium]